MNAVTVPLFSDNTARLTIDNVGFPLRLPIVRFVTLSPVGLTSFILSSILHRIRDHVRMCKVYNRNSYIVPQEDQKKLTGIINVEGGHAFQVDYR
jgi:hypothetical protein